MAANKDELHGSKLAVGINVYIIFMLLLMTGHEIWMMYVHYHVLESLGIDPNPTTFYHGMATFVPSLIILAVTIVACRWSCKRYKTDRIHSLMVLIVTFSAVGYSLQLIVYVHKDVNYFLETIPLVATCYCHNETSPLLPSVSQPLYFCSCRIPFDNSADWRSLVVDNISVTDTTLQVANVAKTYAGAVKSFYFMSSEDAQEAVHVDRRSVVYMFVLIQASNVIIVMGFPLWILLNMSWAKKKVKPLELKIQNTNNCHARRILKLISDLQKLQKQLKKNSHKNIEFGLEISLYLFVEGLDTFAMLDEFLEHADYFAEDKHLTRAVLAIISINLFLVNAYSLPNVGVLLDFDLHKLKFVLVILKFLVVLVNDLAFFFIRSYLFWLYGGINSDDVNSLFLFFIIKEIVIVVLTTVELVIKIQHGKGIVEVF